MGKRKVEMHITKWIAQRRAALEQEVHSMEDVVAQLSKTAEFHKHQGSHGVHMSLRKAQDQLNQIILNPGAGSAPARCLTYRHIMIRRFVP